MLHLFELLKKPISSLHILPIYANVFPFLILVYGKTSYLLLIVLHGGKTLVMTLQLPSSLAKFIGQLQ